MIIPAPCEADWDSMIGNDQVRFCEHCHLHVTNLSALTRQEAMRLVARSEGRLCVRFVKRLDDSVVTKQLPQKLHQIGRRVSRIAAGAFTATLSLSSAAAQTSVVSSQPPVQSIATQPQLDVGSTLTGVVADPQGAVVPNATLTLTSLKDNSYFTYTTADDGMYRFSLLPAGPYRLLVEAFSFESRTEDVRLTDGGERTLNIELQVPQVFEEVEVTSDTQVVQFSGGGAIAFIEPESPLVKAAFHDDLEAVKDLAFSALDLNARDKNVNMTALEQAVENGNLEIVRTLLLAGASVNAKNDNGATALMYLRDNASAALVRELVSARAKVNARDESGGTALMQAAEESNYEVIKELLDAGAKVDLADANGKTALMFAATNEDPRVTKLLIDAGADVNAKDHEGKTALMMAGESGDPEVVKLLISFNADVNATDKKGWTALMYVAETSDMESALALLNAGADLSLRNEDGKTILAVARETPHDDMIKLLESRGAPE
jgi:ankyrin repeat protein